jgi:hypothetical protein
MGAISGGNKMATENFGASDKVEDMAKNAPKTAWKLNKDV